MCWFNRNGFIVHKLFFKVLVVCLFLIVAIVIVTQIPSKQSQLADNNTEVDPASLDKETLEEGAGTALDNKRREEGNQAEDKQAPVNPMMFLLKKLVADLSDKDLSRSH